MRKEQHDEPLFLYHRGTITLTTGIWAIGGNTLTLNGPAIVQTSGNMTGTASSGLTFGPGLTNTNTGLIIPSGVTNPLSNLTLTVGTSTLVTMNGSITLNGTTGLTLNSGLLSIGANNLIFGPSSGVGGTASVTAMILADAASGNTGQVMKQFLSGAPGGFTYPIGDNSGTGPANNPGLDYSPVVLTLSSNSITRTIGVKVTDAQHPDDLTTNNYIPAVIGYPLPMTLKGE